MPEASAGAVVAVLALCLAVMWVSGFREKNGRTPGGVLWAAPLVPFLLAALVLLSGRGHYGSVRISLKALRYDLSALDMRSVTVGGDETNDDIVVKGIPNGFLTFSRTEAGVTASLKNDSSAVAAVVRVGNASAVSGSKKGAAGKAGDGGPANGDQADDAGYPFANAVRVGKAPLTVMADDGAGQSVPIAILEPGQTPRFRSISGGGDPGAYLALPFRKLDPPLLPELPAPRCLRSYWAPDTRIFPVRYYAAPGWGYPQAAAPGDAGAYTETAQAQPELSLPDGNPITSFLCRSGGVKGAGFRENLLKRPLFFVITDPKISVKAQGEAAATHFRSIVATIPPNMSRSFDLFRVDPVAPDEERKGGGFSRCQDLREFKVTYRAPENEPQQGAAPSGIAGPSLFIELKKPAVAVIDRKALMEALARAGKEPGSPIPRVHITTSGFDYGIIPRDDLVAYFSFPGGKLQEELFCRILLPRSVFRPQGRGNVKADPGQDKARMVFHTNKGGFSALPDARFWAGDRVTALMRISPMNLPAGLFILVGAFSLLAAASGYKVRRRPAVFMVLSAVEFFLSLRLLIAYEGALLDPDASSAVAKSILAFALVPWGLTTLAGITEPTGTQSRVSGRFLEIAPQVVHSLAAGIAGWLLLAELDYGNLPRMALCCFMAAAALVQAFTPLRKAVGGWLINRAAGLFKRPLGWFLTIVSITCALRIFLLLLGMKERVGFLSLNALYEPLVIVSFALLWEAYRIRRKKWADDFAAGAPAWKNRAFLLATLGFILPLLIALGLIPLLCRDTGSTFVYTPPVAFVFAAAFLNRPSRWRWGLAFLLLAALFGLFALAFENLQVLLNWLSSPGSIAITVILAAVFVLILPYILYINFVRQHGPRTADFLLCIPMIVILAFFAGAQLRVSGLAGWTRTDFERARTDTSRLTELLERWVSADNNKLRFVQISRPEEVRMAGTREADMLAMVMENLSACASQGFVGRGYLDTEVTSSLANTQMNDNVSAVHVLAPLGTLGALGVMGLLMVMVVLARLPFADKEDFSAFTGGEAAGLMSVWTLFWAAFYMFCANIQALPFTGKNIYFLSADSLSDPVEAGLLAALAILGLKDLLPRKATP